MGIFCPRAMLQISQQKKNEDKPVHGINGGNTSLNHLLGVDARIWIDGLSCTE
jgi:hypothetical protein